MLEGLDRAIGGHAGAAFAFLADMVRAPSMVGSEQAAMEVFAREAEAVGLAVERLPFPGTGIDDPRAGVAPASGLLAADRFQVLAATPGSGDLALLLNGHADVVPAASPELWTTPPFEPAFRDGRLYGRGALDMKSGFAVGMLALRALRDVAPGLFAARRLGFLAVVEEECTGNGTLRSLLDHGVTAREAIVLEPTDLGLMLGGVGVLWVDVTVSSAAGHAHSAVGVDAVELGMRVKEGLRRWADDLQRSAPEPGIAPGTRAYNVNLGRVSAGDWTSSAPAGATLSFRIGFPRGWTPDEAAARVRAAIAAVAEADPDFQAPPGVALTGLRAKGYLADAQSAVVRDLSRAHAQAHGAPPPAFMLGTTTDARFYVEDFGIPAVCFGASGANMHGIDEYVELQSIVDAARTLARFLLIRFGGEEAGL